MKIKKMKKEKCEMCGKGTEQTTLYKRKLKDNIYCFCSQECKTKFELKHGIVDMV